VLGTPREAYPVPVLVGRMVEADGTPIAGAQPMLDLLGCDAVEKAYWNHGVVSVGLWAPPPPGSNFAPDRAGYRATRSDAEGRFRVHGPEFDGRDRLLLLGAPEHPGLPELEVDLGGGAEVLWRALEVQRVSGRFLWPEGFEPTGYYLTYLKGEPSGRRARVPIDIAADGSFVVEAGAGSLSLELTAGLHAFSMDTFWSWKWPEEDSAEPSLDLGEIDVRNALVPAKLDAFEADGSPVNRGTFNVELFAGPMFGRVGAPEPEIRDGRVDFWLPKRALSVTVLIRTTDAATGVSRVQEFGPFNGLGIAERRASAAGAGSGSRDPSHRLVLDEPGGAR
jgi:hypothetical protein